jgi:hypothetical protein
MALMLHSGAESATREQVMSAYAGKATATYQPIPHGHLIDLVENMIPNVIPGARIESAEYALQNGKYKDGDEIVEVNAAECFALFEIAWENEGDRNKTWSLNIAVRNSNSKKFKIAIAIGSRIFICDNLAFSGQFKWEHKHTKNVLNGLKFAAFEQLSQVEKLHEKMDSRFKRLVDCELSMVEAKSLLVDAVSTHAIDASEMVQVLNHYEHPAHKAFEDRNAYSLYNAFTSMWSGGAFVAKKGGQLRGSGIDNIFDHHMDVNGSDLKKDLIIIN